MCDKLSVTKMRRTEEAEAERYRSKNRTPHKDAGNYKWPFSIATLNYQRVYQYGFLHTLGMRPPNPNKPLELEPDLHGIPQQKGTTKWRYPPTNQAPAWGYHECHHGFFPIMIRSKIYTTSFQDIPNTSSFLHNL